MTWYVVIRAWQREFTRLYLITFESALFSFPGRSDITMPAGSNGDCSHLECVGEITTDELIQKSHVSSPVMSWVDLSTVQVPMLLIMTPQPLSHRRLCFQGQCQDCRVGGPNLWACLEVSSPSQTSSRFCQLTRSYSRSDRSRLSGLIHVQTKDSSQLTASLLFTEWMLLRRLWRVSC